MSWLAILLTLAGLGGNPAPDAKPRRCGAAASSLGAASAVPIKQPCVKAKKKRPAPAKPAPRKDAPASTNPAPRSDAPGGEPGPQATPTPRPGATPTPTATATPVATATPAPLPSRTNVDLTDIREWSVRPSYRLLAAGRVEFNANNRGEDEHDLTVRDAAARDLGELPLAPGESGTLAVDLPAGTYTLYCSLRGHEAAGMVAEITTR
ncbi:hypothetical protein DVA67_005945 [Solirubrobacter sp. CPCC 204708]|uniref:Blue (type 1) copper domain-containing protein n=1 Tax=Solirubrobacter deserti TaxID=2282478 RepID=A0ABT4RC87_9ACTN|nr:hypothetical protein [Solirubrobacter deserti]MBE2315508.1 hypothetical protein [Solirubrobacter deserti]MDA0136147.1 hypothetical protein [Solirubrobacter deserti]